MAENPNIDGERKESLPLSKAAEYLLEECRMVLPGIQALFAQKLSTPEQQLHLLAIGLVAVAVALIMTPAAYHRQEGARVVTETFLRLSTRLLLWSMLPLAIGICLDFYLIARIILKGTLVPLLAVLLFAVYAGLWFALPRSRRLKRMAAGLK